MIKVNLLATGKREPVARKGPAVSVEGLGTLQNVGIIFLLLATAGFVAWRYYGLSNEIVRLDREIEEKTVLLKKVEEDRRVADELEKKRQKVEHQIDLITRLKNEQQMPVRLLDEISKNLPEFLWLTNLNESGGQLTFTGRATTPNAYANFYNNLDASPYFYDVGRIAYRDDGAQGVSFSLSAKFKANPEKQASTEGGGAEGGR